MYYDFKKLKAIFGRIAQANGYSTAFSDLLDHALLPFRYFPDGGSLKAAFEKWKSYRHLQALTEFLAELADLAPDGFGDPLGEFYMREISHGRLGQYFTPENIMDMMVSMVITPGDGSRRSVFDPACGSGRFILRAAKVNRNMDFYGADLDAVCCRMTLLNMLLNSLTGEVAHMDSLSNEFYTGYKVQTRLIGGYHHPYYVEFTDPGQSMIWMRPEKTVKTPVVVQGDLFGDMQ